MSNHATSALGKTVISVSHGNCMALTLGSLDIYFHPTGNPKITDGHTYSPF